MLDLNRSHDATRRSVLGRYFWNGKNAHKRDPALHFSVYIPGPSVLGSKLVPKSRLFKLNMEARKKDEEKANNRNVCDNFRLPKKDSATRKEFKPWDVKLVYAILSKKRFRFPLPEKSANEPSKSDTTNMAANSNKTELGVSMVVVSEKDALPDKGEKLDLPDSLSLLLRRLSLWEMQESFVSKSVP